MENIQLLEPYMIDIEPESTEAQPVRLSKQDFKEYLSLKQEQRQIEEEILELKQIYISSPVLDGMPGNGKISDITARYAMQLSDLYTKLLYKKYEVTLILTQIEDAIACLEPGERVLMREYYIKGLNWEKVCDVIGYSWAQTHRMHKRIIHKLTEERLE